jgi:hypothetical protein
MCFEPESLISEEDVFTQVVHSREQKAKTMSSGLVSLIGEKILDDSAAEVDTAKVFADADAVVLYLHHSEQ